MILALAGGVGGARLASGLARVLAPDSLAIAVNVGDDFEHLGLAISPDLDTVMYTLAGLHNPATGWGRADETWSFIDTLATLGGPTWFRLGDRDLAVHVERTRRLRAGEPLSAITARLCAQLGVRHAVMPVTDDPLRTVVESDAGALAFQDYFVRLRCEPVAHGFRFDGAAAARLSAPLAALIDGGRVEGIVICPSNPWLSIAPMRAVTALERVLAGGSVPVVAVSPIIAGAAVKGPAAKIMRELGVEVSALGVARHYDGIVDRWVIDRADAALEPALTASGCRVALADALMDTPAKADALARAALDLLSRPARARLAP